MFFQTKSCLIHYTSLFLPSKTERGYACVKWTKTDLQTNFRHSFTKTLRFWCTPLVRNKRSSNYTKKYGRVYSRNFIRTIKKKKKQPHQQKIIARVLGILLFVETTMFLICALVSWMYQEPETFTFLQTAAINTFAGIFLILLSRGAERKVSKRDGYCIASLSWLLFSAFGMLPFYLSGSVDSISNAFLKPFRGLPQQEPLSWTILMPSRMVSSSGAALPNG